MGPGREGERAEIRAMQREKERERRRLRDRQRRQNMSQDQRDKHLARRRRNYQLRRLRAQNSHLLASKQPFVNLESPASEPESESESEPEPELEVIKPPSSHFPQLDLPMASTIQDIRGAEKMQNFPKRLRLSDVKHLARTLHSDDQNQTGEEVTTKDSTNSISCVESSMKRLRLVHVKRLARSIKLSEE